MQIDSKKQYVRNKFSLLKNYKSAVLTAVVLMVTGHIFFSNITSDVLVFGVLAFYISAIYFYKLKAKTTFIICFFILAAFSIQFIFTSISSHTEKAAVWLFLFLSIGIIQELWQFENEKN